MSSEPNFSEEDIDSVIEDVIFSVQDFEDDGACEELQRWMHTWCSHVMACQVPNDLPPGILIGNNLQSSEDNNSVIGPNSACFPVKQDGKEYIAGPEPKDDVAVKEKSPNKDDKIEAK